MNIDVLKDLSPAEPASAGDLPPFGLFAAGVYPFLEFRWFHEAYYRVLEAFAAGRVRRLIVTMPPQHGKSVGASTLLPAYLLGRNPDLRIAIASYSASLASKFNRRVQRIIDSPEYAAFFPETTIKRGARPPEYLRTADEVEIIGHRGGLLSVGREGALTGNRVDCFILDDLYTDIPGTNKSVIALSAEEQRYMRPFTYKGRAYQRIESVTSAMPQGIYNLLVMQRGGTYAWDSMQNPSLKISDLDETAILGAVRGGIRGGRLPEGSMQEDVRTILEKFDLLNDGKLNNASVVLFGRNFYHYPQCLLRLARFKGTTKDEFLDNQRVTGNIFNLLDAAMAFFFKHLSLSGKIEGLYREEELNVPYKALRECCINAFAHRVYHRPGSSVGIAIYDDRVEIENSGTFPPDITIEKLLGGHNSEPQNLIVANVLYKSAVLESWGRGIALMVNECRRVGIPDPEFHTDGNAVWIVFHYTRTTVGQDPTAPPQQPYSNPTVTPQLGKLLSAIGNNTLSAKEIMEKTGMKDKRNFLKNYIHPAINSGLVLSLYPIGSKSPQQKYYLTDKGKGFLQQ